MNFQYTFPPMEEYTMSTGMRVIWLPDFRHPVITVTLQIPVGRFYDPFSSEGTAELTASLMLKGPKSLSSEAFAEIFENAGATVFADVKDEYIIIGVRMLKKAADTIVPLFWEMITDSVLDAREFSRLKKEMITGLRAEFADPATLANRHFYAELFGATHPAGRNHTLDTVKHVSLEQIIKFCNDYITPQNSCLVVAGACELDTMKNQWEALFQTWKKEAHVLPANTHTVPDLQENRIRIIDKPELSQTTILLGHQGITELNMNKVPLAIANYILGGGNFSSRLMARIRTETGRTYGIASQLSSMKNYGLFTIGTSTQNNQLQGVISSILDVYATFMHDGPTESEIEKAKQFATGNMAFELEGLNNIVEKLVWLRFYGRENSYIEQFNSMIEPIDCSAVKDALQEDFASQHFVIIAVGRKTEIAGQLEQFGTSRFFKCRDNPLKN